MFLVIKIFLQKKPQHKNATMRAIITNTYRTLMTRGMKGC
ncbi:MAG: DNA/RNA helicase domain-containing protein [Chitinophagaceae bacterium]